jgi:phosphatidate cytidylyltransferase
MRQRLISAAVLVPVVVIVFWLGRPWTSVGIAVIAALAAWEIAELFGKAGLPANRWLVVLAPVALIAGFEYTNGLFFFGYGSPDIEIALVAGWVLLAGFDGLRYSQPRQGFLALAGTLTASLYSALLAFAAGILVFHVGDSGGSGQFWLLLLVLTVWTLDSAAYIVGKYFPRGRFMNHISPNKTWSGAIGGTIAAILVCTAIVVVRPNVTEEPVSPLVGVLLGVVIAFAAQAGDLAESLIKRAAGAKDSGTLIPGHGGFLDRVDSFLFAAPAMYIALQVLVHARLGVQ